jgi:hypothetical protein
LSVDSEDRIFDDGDKIELKGVKVIGEKKSSEEMYDELGVE